MRADHAALGDSQGPDEANTVDEQLEIRVPKWILNRECQGGYHVRESVLPPVVERQFARGGDRRDPEVAISPLWCCVGDAEEAQESDEHGGPSDLSPWCSLSSGLLSLRSEQLNALNFSVVSHVSRFFPMTVDDAVEDRYEDLRC